MATKTLIQNNKTQPGALADAMPCVRVVLCKHESKLELRERLQMTRQNFSRLVNVSVRAIAAVEKDQTEVAKLQRPYAEAARLYKALSEVVEPSAIGPWFMTPNENFNRLKPIEVIERGEIDRLWDMVYRLQSGMTG